MISPNWRKFLYKPDYSSFKWQNPTHTCTQPKSSWLLYCSLWFFGPRVTVIDNNFHYTKLATFSPSTFTVSQSCRCSWRHLSLPFVLLPWRRSTVLPWSTQMLWPRATLTSRTSSQTATGASPLLPSQPCSRYVRGGGHQMEIICAAIVHMHAKANGLSNSVSIVYNIDNLTS